MNELDQYILLSNSKFTGMSTCRYLNGVTKNKRPIEEYLLHHAGKVNDLKNKMNSNNIQVFSPELNYAYDNPKFLMKCGNGSYVQPKVGIIGSRTCTTYGKRIAYRLGYDLSKLGIQIVSGLAYGIDYAAHEGAVKASGSTMAILGSGLLNCYPKKHEAMYRKIQENGLVVSEYGMLASPLKHHFPFRNRLIAGFSDVLIVVEAAVKSGTMITVNYALEQGKTIMAVPGSIHSEYSKGSHHLIRQGAVLCSSIEDVIEELQLKLIINRS